MRYYLANAVILYAFKYLYEKKYVKFLFFVIIAFTIHRASVGILLPFFILITFRKHKFISLGILAIFLIISFRGLNFLQSFNEFERYAGYVENISFSGFGIGNIVIVAPMFLIYLYTYFQKTNKGYAMDVILIFMLSALTYTFIGYAIPIFGRMQVIFNCQYVLFIPYMIKSIGKNKKDQMLIKMLTVIYIVILIWQYFERSLYSDGIMPYMNQFFDLL